MQLYQNLTILSESSDSVKLLLWDQDYCSVPKRQTQNIVTAIRIIAKATTWKTSTVLVASTQPKALEKMFNLSTTPVERTNINATSDVLLPVLVHTFSFLILHKYV